MLEAFNIIERSAPLYTDAELLLLCAAFDDQLVECQTALAGATSWVEEWSHHAVLEQVLQVTYSCWPSAGLELPRPPFVAIDSVSIRSDGNDLTLTSSQFRLSKNLVPARLFPTDQIPSIDTEEDAITVKYVAGAASREEANGILVSSVESLTKHFFEHPGDTEGDFCRAIKNTLRPIRIANINGIR